MVKCYLFLVEVEHIQSRHFKWCSGLEVHQNSGDDGATGATGLTDPRTNRTYWCYWTGLNWTLELGYAATPGLRVLDCWFIRNRWCDQFTGFGPERPGDWSYWSRTFGHKVQLGWTLEHWFSGSSGELM